MRSLIKLQKLALQGSRHVLMFPEGTRHADGKIHDFFTGFGLIAQKIKRPVIPIAVSGLYKIFPKKRFSIDPRAAIVKICIGKPLMIQDDETAKEFTTRVRQWYVKTLKDLQQ